MTAPPNRFSKEAIVLRVFDFYEEEIRACRKAGLDREKEHRKQTRVYIGISLAGFGLAGISQLQRLGVI